jgi:hypothetical protein
MIVIKLREIGNTPYKQKDEILCYSIPECQPLSSPIFPRPREANPK